VIGSGPPRLVALVAAGLLAAAGTLAPGFAAPASAKAPDLTLVGAAVYEVQPDRQRVHVTVDLVATNRSSETVTTRYVFDRLNLSVLPGTTGFRATNNGVKVTASVTSRTPRATLLTIRFAKTLSSGHSTGLHLTFDLPDPGGAPSRDIRIGDALAMFPVWAYGTSGTPGSTVTVRFPAGYQAQATVGKLGAPTTGPDGTVSLASGPLPDPLRFVAYVVADRPGAYVETPLAIGLGDRTAILVVRAWKDDPMWGTRIAALLRTGLPALAAAIELPYPQTDTLAVEEAVGRSIGGVAGVFDPTTGAIRLAYAAGSTVALREVAHLWFNGRLFADRWIAEGFAAWAGEQAATTLKSGGSLVSLTPALATTAIPLNAWAVSAAGDAPSTADPYGYAASAELVRLIVARTGPTGLKAVLAAATAHEATYQPATTGGATTGSATTAATTAATTGPAAPTDWRGLLDLLAERAGVDATDLWRTWVARSQDFPLLDARTRARADYASLLAASGQWRVPPSIRDALGAWRFDVAEARMGAARAALTARDELAVAAALAGLTPPSGSRRAYEADDLEAAAAESHVGRAIVDQIVAARAAGARPADLLIQVGLLGQDPLAELDAASAAFTAGDLAVAQARAIGARETWAGAADLGGLRLRVLAALALAVAVAVAALFVATRTRRRTRSRPLE
jgi:hypothetical protein